ncbi:hypothetical protein ZWY2020_009363 [Hordeum vulgare]|nr:hypothetical protein ZWY2020_009363 [Hordeum vulgare]
MTTAARPTWAPTKGGNEQGGTHIFGHSGKYSSRDLAAHTSLKPRWSPNDCSVCADPRDPEVDAGTVAPVRCYW